MTASRTIRVLPTLDSPCRICRAQPSPVCPRLTHRSGPPHFGRSPDSACLLQVRLDRKRQKS